MVAGLGVAQYWSMVVLVDESGDIGIKVDARLMPLTPIDSQSNDFLTKFLIARFEPPILGRIDEDLERHAKKKKLLRLADAQFLAGS